MHAKKAGLIEQNMNVLENKDRVSVLVTFYNQEKYVDRALKSIINQQTDFGVHIIVGDDGSSDKTCEFVRGWEERHPGKIELHIMDRLEGNQFPGFRASRNRLNLLKYVNTEYFAYLDGDDFFCYEEKLQRQVDIMDNPSNSDCSACAHNIDLLYSDGRRFPLLSAKIKERKYEPKEYWKSLYFHTDTLLIRSKVIPKINVTLLENCFNDNMITFSVIQEGKLYYLNESWAVYYQTGDGIWTAHNKVVNSIRSLQTYEICNMINPDMKNETDYRFSFTWLALLFNRKKIKVAELGAFCEEAQDKKMKHVNDWIHYDEQRFISRIVLCFRAALRGGIDTVVYLLFLKRR